MRAAFITKHGGLDVLEVGEVPTPVPAASEVLVRLKVSALNHLDIWVRKGIPGLKLSYPHILGGDGAGIVDKTGEEVIVHPGLSCGTCEKCKTGWETLCPEYKILGEHISGTNAEYVKVPKGNIFPKPKNLSFDEAASVPLVFTTAWQMLKRAEVKKGDSVLIHAAGSGVSSAGIQIAKLFGCEVIATSSTAAKLELAKKLGADHVINYREKDFAKEMRTFKPKGMDVIFDHVGKEFWGKNIKCLRSGGALVTCGATTGNEAVTDLNHVFYRQLRILGSTMGSKQDFPTILKHLAEGKLKAVVDKKYSLKDIKQAHQRMEEAGQFGKVLISTE